MFEIPLDDLVFLVCTIVGGGLLLITVPVDDILGGLLEALNIEVDIGGVSLMPLLLGFVSMFGVGGLFARQVLDIHGGSAEIIGTVSGLIGAIVYVMFSALRRFEGKNPFSTASLVGRNARDLLAVPGIERFAALRLAELDRSGPRPLRRMWRIARDQLGERDGELTIGEVLDRYGRGGGPTAGATATQA